MVVAAATLALVCGCRARRKAPPCPTVFEARDWVAARIACAGPTWKPYAEMIDAWHRESQMELDEALALRRRYEESRFADDALCIAGYVHTRRDSQPVTIQLGREMLWQAYYGYLFSGRLPSASFVASHLARIASATGQLEEAVRVADTAVHEGEASRLPCVHGLAEAGLAEVHDQIGIAEAARDGFNNAIEHLSTCPEKQSYAFLKQGIFLLDRGTVPEMTASLEAFHLAAKAATRNDTIANAAVRKLVFGIELNLTVALAMLNRFDEAEHTLTIQARSDLERQRVALARGYLAARRGDVSEAEALLAEASVGELTDEYRWEVPYEIAQLHHRKGNLAAAEDAYRHAIVEIEAIRAQSGIELRPWVMDRLSRPYRGLMRLLAEQHKDFDALVQAEALHARAWLDAVVAIDPAVETAEALRGARVRRQQAAPPLDDVALRAAIGDREALTFVVDGVTIWRAHVRGPEVQFVALSDADVAAITAFRQDPTSEANAEAAGAVLIPAEVVASDAPLYIVADGDLANLWFTALRRGGHYLIEERPLANLPGLAALTCRPLRPWTGRSVLIGNPTGDLDKAEKEVRDLAATIPAAALHTQDTATHDAVLAGRDASHLHIAAHAEDGAIVLADGPLTAAEIVDEQLAPREVVLTVCAASYAREGESLGGLPSAFLAAGSRHVVATLRSVRDTDAATFAAHYYAEGLPADPVRRLAATQRAMIRNHEPITAWASFAVWGAAACDR